MVIRSIDPPHAFFTSNADTLFSRKEVMDCSGPMPRLLREEKQDTAFRALDAWMFQAQHAKNPDASQAIIKRILPEPSMIEDYKVKKINSHTTQCDLTFNSTKLRCTVKSNGEVYQVLSVKVLKP